MPYRLTIEPLGESVEVGEKQTLLDAALRQGIWMPHACGHAGAWSQFETPARNAFRVRGTFIMTRPQSAPLSFTCRSILECERRRSH